MSGTGDTLIGPTTSTFDLYDFFSMLLPGAALLLGLMPFIPQSLPMGTFETLFVLLAGGYILGRGIHSAAESVDGIRGTDSHRDVFGKLMRDESSSDISQETVGAYYEAAREQFDHIDWPRDRQDLSTEQVTMLYVHTRALIHRDGNGRSRTFQAIYAFYRSITLVVVTLIGFYVLYAFGESFSYWDTIFTFETYVGVLDLPPLSFLLVSEIVLALTVITFHDAKYDYREYFIQYLFADFLILTSD